MTGSPRNELLRMRYCALVLSAHVAAATENFLVLENHAVDVPYWSDLVDGIEKLLLSSISFLKRPRQSVPLPG